MVRLAASLAALLCLALVAPAVAAASAEGLWGPVDDKVITYSGLLLVAAIPLLITVLTIVQSTRERAKERRQADLTRLRRD